MLYKISKVHLCLLGMNGFHVKAKNERFTAVSLHCRQNLKYENFMLSFGRLPHEIAPKGMPREQRNYFFLIQPIKSLICGVAITIS